MVEGRIKGKGGGAIQGVFGCTKGGDSSYSTGVQELCREDTTQHVKLFINQHAADHTARPLLEVHA